MSLGLAILYRYNDIMHPLIKGYIKNTRNEIRYGAINKIASPYFFKKLVVLDTCFVYSSMVVFFDENITTSPHDLKFEACNLDNYFLKYL